jgi:hypothetical protein
MSEGKMEFHLWKIEDTSHDCATVIEFILVRKDLEFKSNYGDDFGSDTDMGEITEEEIEVLKKFGIINNKVIHIEEDNELIFKRE